MAALLTVGLLVVAATCLAPEPGSSERSVTGVRRRAVQLAQGSAAAWLSGNLVLIGLVYSDASGSRLDAPGFWEQAAFFATSYELGQYLLWGAVLAAAVAATCALASSVAFLGVAALLSLAGLWPMALTGHAAGTLQHIDAVNLQMFHLVGIGVWAGGLLALVLLRPYLGTGAGAPIRHFSTLATWGLLLVTVSGVLGAALRLPSPGAIVSTYGALLGLKLAAVVVLAGLGHRQRHRLASEADLGGRTRFWRVLALEAAILVGAAGTGVALTRTAPPAPSGSPRPLTAAEAMLGSSLPP
ncbi:MAG: copper resistance D family protein, partial [Nocardioides sp.]